MNDDGLTRDLESWAMATDPAIDPITAVEVQATDQRVLPSAPPRRRWLAAAAVWLSLAGLAAATIAVVTSSGTEDQQVATGDDASGGARTQVVIEAPDLDPAGRDVAHRIVLRDPTGRDVLARPLEPGTSLVVDQVLTSGRWHLLIQRFDCTSEAEDCGATGLDGLPEASPSPAQCALPFDVDTTEERVVVGFTSAPGTIEACGFPTDPQPVLTVAPAWSLRSELPWSCGAATRDINGQAGGADPQGALATLDCFTEAIEDGTPVEIPVAEPQSGDGLTRSWWRVLPEPVDGHRVEALRNHGPDGAPTWAVIRCDGVTVETSDVDSTTPEGGITGYQHVGARLTGCGEEVTLPLELPALDLATMATTTTPTTTPGSRSVDVVLDLEPSAEVEPAVEWWVLTERAEGAEAEVVATDEVDAGGPRQVALVAEGLVVSPGHHLQFTRARMKCNATCPELPLDASDLDGLLTTCSVDVPTDGDVVVVTTTAGQECDADPVADVPVLTVPPEWSLRAAPAVRCRIPEGGTAEDAGECLLAAQSDGRTAEWWTTDEDGAPLIWRVNAARDVDLVHPGVGGETWTREPCLGAALLDLVPGPEADGCAPEEAMSLEP